MQSRASRRATRLALWLFLAPSNGFFSLLAGVCLQIRNRRAVTIDLPSEFLLGPEKKLYQSHWQQQGRKPGLPYGASDHN